MLCTCRRSCRCRGWTLTDMGVGGADHAEFERIDPQRRPRAGGRDAGPSGRIRRAAYPGFCAAEVEVAYVPGFESREFVCGRQQGWASPSPFIWVAS